MTPEKSMTTGGTDTERKRERERERGPDGTRETVQLLVADAGNRTVIEGMLSDHFDVDTGHSVREADLYLIEDHLFSEYHDELRDRVDAAHPVFCPVVLLRRETTTLNHGKTDPASDERPVLIDDVVDAPIDPPLLIRRLRSLLVRRRQSRELMEQVSTLEGREQELRRFERGVEATGNGIVMTDRTGTIEYVNPAFEEVTKYTESDVLGRSLRLLQPGGPLTCSPTSSGGQ
jgi:PAS domain-containing protein